MVTSIADRPTVNKIYVLADKASNPQEESKTNPKIEVLRLWEPDAPLSIIALLWQILRLKPDIIHFNVHFQSYGKTRVANFVGFLLIPLSKIFRLKTLVLLHNLAEKVDLQKVSLKASFFNKAGILVATKLALSASSVVVTVESYVDYLKERYRPKRLRFIPHGTSPPRLLSTNHKEKVLLLFGHMGPSKGLPIMFRAFESLHKQLKDTKLIIAGDSHPNFPNYLHDMKKIAPKEVDFTGYIQEENLPKIFSIADVVVLPYSTATGTSGVFHIACGYGKPIVATSLPEITELVNKGASALLVQPKNEKALKEAILKVLSNRRLAAEMSQKNLAFAGQQQWSTVAEAYESEYLKLSNFILPEKSKLCVPVALPICEAPDITRV